jgi:endoglucanase
MHLSILPFLRKISLPVLIILFAASCNEHATQEQLKLNSKGYFEKTGWNVFVFNNFYNGYFGDSKIGAIEMIHHGDRTVTNGDLRLNSTPAQWDPIPVMKGRTVDSAANAIEVHLLYEKYDFSYTLKARPGEGGIYLSVILEKPLPASLAGKAGFNLEFLPSAYFGKSYMSDRVSGTFPLYPSGSMTAGDTKKSEPFPLAGGKNFTLAPEDPLHRISIRTESGEILLFDGRNQAQNGWFVLRTLIPSGQTGEVVKWFVEANTLEKWVRKPVIAHSQLGYLPAQVKEAVIELDKNDPAIAETRLLKIGQDGKNTLVYSAKPIKWGSYLRYNYVKFDFSEVREPGLYFLEYGDVSTKPFRISENIYEDAWYPTLDMYLNVQMDHMYVNEAYRVWHGLPHMDDALQAPVNYVHFDLYAQGPVTDTPYKPGQHIPGLNYGGWFDAGDFDIRTQTHYDLVRTLAHTWETFGITRDETTIDEDRKYADLHVPDGVPDIIQQVKHGTLALIAQFRAVGHAIPGIIAPDLPQYTHLGDAGSITDGKVCNEKLIPFNWADFAESNCDDRWAFTSRSSSLNYGSASALAAASRVLKNYDPKLAQECLSTSIKVWNEEHSQVPDTFRFGNTTGGPLQLEELNAAVELLITTGDKKYSDRITEMLPYIRSRFFFTCHPALLALPYMNDEYRQSVKEMVKNYVQLSDTMVSKNPFGVPVSRGGWAGSGQVLGNAVNFYLMAKAFPDIVDPEHVFRGLNYIFGCHPGSDISFVSGVGTSSKTVAYGNNRADFSFIAGGIVPGVLILEPDFPENKEDWPFLWGENEYVVSLGGDYIYLVNAAIDLQKGMKQVR